MFVESPPSVLLTLAPENDPIRGVTPLGFEGGAGAGVDGTDRMRFVSLSLPVRAA